MSPIGMTARLLTQVCCFLYPAYRGYKIIEADSADPEAVRTAYGLVTYWAVVGVWLTIESVIGWTFTWIPFYYVFRFLVLFYLSLPQTEAAEWVYDNYLAPAFRDHERDIDVFVAGMRGRAMTGLSTGLSWLWDKIRGHLTGQGQSATAEPTGYDLHHQPAIGIAQPPTMLDPASGPAQQLFGLFTRYAGQYTPVVLAALSSAATAARSATSSTPSSDPNVASQVPETISMPIPRPKVDTATSETSLRSRTYRQAQSSLGSSATSSARARQVSMPGISQRSSEESVGSAASVGSVGSQRDVSGYDQIAREEVVDYPKEPRPASGKRRSSWFGAWGSPDRQKAE